MNVARFMSVNISLKNVCIDNQGEIKKALLQFLSRFFGLCSMVDFVLTNCERKPSTHLAFHELL